MPGRQYTGRLAKTQQQQQSVKPHKSQRKQKKRAQNALAVAEVEYDDTPTLRRSRLGDVEPEFRKRPRDDGNDQEDSDEGGGGGQRKRTKSGLRERYGKDADYGSDSEGNEWVTGQVNEEDDESLDSDEAFGESDEERFEGFTFRGSKRKNTRPKSKRASGGLLDEDGELEDGGDVDSDAESENFAENAVDLHTMLDDNFDEDQSEPDDDKRRMRQSKDGADMRGSAALSLEAIQSDDEDEEEDEEEEVESVLSIDDEDEEDDFVSEARSRALLDMVTGLGNGDLTEEKAKKERDRAREALVPTSIVAQGGGIEDLLEGLDPSMRKLMGAAVQSGRKPGKGIPGKVEVPLPQRQQGRLDRAAAYEKSKETLARWIDTVKQNRRAEHLSFPLINRDELSAKNTDRFRSLDVDKPFNDLEAAIQTILAENGMLQKDPESQEEDGDNDEGGMKLAEAPVSKLSLQDVLAQRAELRKARELLFREEIKAKRIKKIKSRSYRKVHRKARERGLQKQQEADAENGVLPDEDEQERLDRLRAEARMGDKHRESKFAKAMKATGRTAWDEDARNGMLDMARREEELKKRIHGDTIHDDDSFGDDSEDEGDDEDAVEEQLFELREEPEAKGPGSRLANMQFMQRAEAAKRKQNEETIAQIQRDLDGRENSESSTDDDGPGRRKFGPSKEVALPLKKQGERNEFEERERSDLSDFDQDDDTVEVVTTKSTEPGSQKSISKTGAAISDRRRPQSRAQEKDGAEEGEADGDGWTNLLQAASKQSRQKRPVQADVTLDVDTDLATSRAAIQASKASSKTTQTSRPPPQTLLKQVRLLPSGAGDDDDDDDGTSSSGSDSDSETPRLTAQQSALQRAFAGDEVIASFEAEKAAVAADERSPSPTADVLPGWGSWTGGGLSKRDRRERTRRNARLQQAAVAAASKTPADFMAARKGARNGKRVDQTRRDAKLANVIISEKKPAARSSKYLAGALPHPFETRQQYERSLRVPVGPEWTTKETFQRSTKPRVVVGGGVIRPMEKPLI